MQIKYYGYNTFIIKSKNKIIAIDPGADLYFFRLKSLIPKKEWKNITHIFVTHGDPDHHWYTDRVAKTSNAKVICNKTMVREKNGINLMLGPRDKGLSFTKSIKNLHTISVNETIELDGIRIKGIKATHGPVTFKIGPFSKTLNVGTNERMGWGAIGFKINIDEKIIVNLGDTLLNKSEWKMIGDTDVLMIPIGGKIPHNTMDESEALKAVDIIKPKVVIPCHYNCPALFSNNYNPADDKMFKEEVENKGIKCTILERGESFNF
ncbi:MAG: MBL fold metallo-hydrolase [Candidatus Dadabacteria bacterium]|nr:MBL fold metallo-hydrolase [Candidatus Dadabacteria bacterium]NIQ16938.1 MBL fold metallo-hydrolase [Candidatus Dadabacteria bacterium]